MISEAAQNKPNQNANLVGVLQVPLYTDKKTTTIKDENDVYYKIPNETSN